jgi:hypothetical protein
MTPPSGRAGAPPRICRTERLRGLPGIPEAGPLRRTESQAPGAARADLAGGASWRHGVRSQGDRGHRTLEQRQR